MKFLIIFLLIIFITPYLIRLISPFLLKYFFKKVEKNMNEQYQQQQQNQDNYQQNNNDPNDPQKKKAKEELGDYVDFEEIPEEEK